jgi:hypothetical protein
LAQGHTDGADERQQQPANRFQLHGNSTLPCSTVRGFGRSSLIQPPLKLLSFPVLQF